MFVRPTMFQCMVRWDNNTTQMHFDLKQMRNNARKENSQIIDVKARAPGSLGQNVYEHEDHWKIGSLALRMMLNKTITLSVFIFENGKVKISGGSSLFDRTQQSYEQWLEKTVIHPTIEILLKLAASPILVVGCVNQRPEECFSWQLCLLNGSMSMDTRVLNPSNYREWCDLLMNRRTEYIVASTLPPCFDSKGGNKRGRVCCMTLVFMSKEHKKSTIRFDHGGRVQFFGFTSFDTLRFASRHFIELFETPKE